MSKSGVSKYCSILNYLKHNHEDLYELIQDLCIGRIFNPRKGSDGVTFLCPDKALMAELKKQASGSDPEKAVEMIQSIVIPDHLPSLSDFEGDLPTMVRGKKITVDKSSSSSVELSGGASVSHDKNWEHRKDRTNLAVHTLSGSFPSLSDSGASAEPKKRAKKGGADIEKLERKGLFDAVMMQCCEKSCRDPAMEVLVSLLQYLEENKNNKVLDLVRSQLSADTLGSLYVILQPNGAATEYLSTDLIRDFCSKYHNPSFKLFCYVHNPASIYNEHMSAYQKPDKVVECLDNCRAKIMGNASKVNLLSHLQKALQELSNVSSLARGDVQVPPNQLQAEAELRVRSALMRIDYEQYGCLDKDECVRLYNQDLGRPTFNQELINTANVAYYYSTVYLIARSDALFYMPGLKSNLVLSNNAGGVVDEESVIALLPSKLEDDKIDTSYKWIATFKGK